MICKSLSPYARPLRWGLSSSPAGLPAAISILAHLGWTLSERLSVANMPYAGHPFRFVTMILLL